MEPVLRTNADTPGPHPGRTHCPVLLGDHARCPEQWRRCPGQPWDASCDVLHRCPLGLHTCGPCHRHAEDMNQGGPSRPGLGPSGTLPPSCIRTVPGILKIDSPSEGWETWPGQVSPPLTLPSRDRQAPPLWVGPQSLLEAQSSLRTAGHPLSASRSDLRPLKTVPTLASGQPEPLTPCTLSGVCKSVSPTNKGPLHSHPGTCICCG